MGLEVFAQTHASLVEEAVAEILAADATLSGWATGGVVIFDDPETLPDLPTPFVGVYVDVEIRANRLGSESENALGISIDLVDLTRDQRRAPGDRGIRDAGNHALGVVLGNQRLEETALLGGAALADKVREVEAISYRYSAVDDDRVLLVHSRRLVVEYRAAFATGDRV